MPQFDDLVANNQRFADAFDDPGLPTAPRRQLAIVCCMDSRIDIFAVLGLHNGEAHIIRNAGGIVTGDVIRSLLISQRLLQTREILVLQHTRCGLDGLDEQQFAAQVLADCGALPPHPVGAFTNIAASVRASVGLLRESPLIQSDLVRGAIYDVDSGKVLEVEATIDAPR